MSTDVASKNTNIDSNLHQAKHTMDNNHTDIDIESIAIDSDDDVILEETTQKMVSFTNNENRIRAMVANTVSNKTSLKIKQEIMTSPQRLLNADSGNMETSPESEWVKMEKNKKSVVNTKKLTDACWSEGMDEDSPKDREVQEYRQRRIESSTNETTTKMATPPNKEKHAIQVPVSRHLSNNIFYRLLTCTR